MKRKDLRGKAAVIGYGDYYVRHKDSAHRMMPVQLAAEAVKKALDNAGVKKEQITALYTGRSPSGDTRQQWNNIFASYMKITPTLSSQITVHGAGVNSLLHYATMAIVCGLADYVLCVQSDSPVFVDSFAFVPTIDTDQQYEYPFAPIIPALYAMWATRYMHEYGVREEDLARVAVAHQDWAVHHPYATKGPAGPITVEKVLSSPYIAKPFHLWDCAQRGPDGTAGAFVVTSAERARDHTDKPIYILGYGELSTHEYVTDRMALRSSPYDLGTLPNLTHTATREAARQAFEMAGLRPSDMDVVATASNFTITVMLALEDLGFCPKGGAASLVGGGRIDPGGDLPVNTNGGWLSFGQPGISCGMDSIMETVRQLRGEALGLQVSHPKFGVVQCGGGMLACHTVSILGTEVPN
jgi:acetyl-CoA acetyltransferase